MQGQPGLYSKFEDSLGYVKPDLKIIAIIKCFVSGLWSNHPTERVLL